MLIESLARIVQRLVMNRRSQSEHVNITSKLRLGVHADPKDRRDGTQGLQRLLALGETVACGGIVVFRSSCAELRWEASNVRLQHQTTVHAA